MKFLFLILGTGLLVACGGEMGDERAAEAGGNATATVAVNAQSKESLDEPFVAGEPLDLSPNARTYG